MEVAFLRAFGVVAGLLRAIMNKTVLGPFSHFQPKGEVALAAERCSWNVLPDDLSDERVYGRLMLQVPVRHGD